MRINTYSYGAEQAAPAVVVHPVAAQLATLVGDKIVEVKRLTDAAAKHDFATVNSILGISNTHLVRMGPAGSVDFFSVYLQNARAQVIAVGAAAIAVQSGDSAALNAALAAADPATAKVIATIVKPSFPGLKYGAMGAAAVFGDAGMLSIPLLVLGGGAVLKMMGKPKLPPSAPPPPSPAELRATPPGTPPSPPGTLPKVPPPLPPEQADAAAAQGSDDVGAMLEVGRQVFARIPISAPFVKAIMLVEKIPVVGPAVKAIGEAPVRLAAKAISAIFGSGPPPPVVDKVPVGTMIRRDSGDVDSVYIVGGDGSKHHITSGDVVNALGGDVVRVFARLIDAAPTGADVITAASGFSIRASSRSGAVNRGTLIRRDSGDTGSIYITGPDGSKHHVSTMDVVNGMGGTGAVITVNAAAVDAMSTGPDVGDLAVAKALRDGTPLPPPPPPPATVMPIRRSPPPPRDRSLKQYGDPAWLKYATSRRMPEVAQVDADGNPVAWKLPPLRGFSSFADVIYTVKRGDTLTQIVLDQGLCQKGSGNSVADWAQCVAVANAIAAANGLSSPDALQVGQRLVLGAAQVSQTQDGATVVGPVVPVSPPRTALGTVMLGLGLGLGIWVVFGKWR